VSSASDRQVMTITNHERIIAKIRVNTLNFICVRGHKLVCTSDRIPDLFCSFSNFDISKSFLLIFIRSKTSGCFVIKPPHIENKWCHPRPPLCENYFWRVLDEPILKWGNQVFLARDDEVLSVEFLLVKLWLL
jgi:hypothetical protein